MKISVKKLDANKKELSVEVSGDAVKNKFNSVYQKIAKEVKIPGFRPGNAPRDVIDKHHPGLANEQVLKELIPEVYDGALKQEKISAIDLPEIKDVQLKPDLLSFTATVTVSPEIKLANYKGLKINYKKAQVSEDEMKKAIDNFKSAKKLENLDDAFARGLGYPSLKDFDDALRQQICLQKENLNRQNMEEEILEQLIKSADFVTPKVLVDRQLKELVSRTKADLSLRGVPKDKIDAEEKNIEERLRPQAERQVKVYLVLEEIAKKENIAIDDHMPHQVMELLLREAQWSIEG